MCGPQFLPRCDRTRPVVRRAPRDADARLDANVLRVAPRLTCVGTQTPNGVAGCIARRQLWEPTVADASRALQGRLDAPTQPDRNRALHRQRIDPCRLNVMPAAVEGHRVLREEGAQHGNLLLTALATIPEVLVQRLVFDRIPPDANAETEASPAQDVDLRRLLGDQDGLALRQDQDAGDKLQTLREAREVPKQHQRLMEEAAIGVRAAPVTVMRCVGPDDMIEGQQVRVAERLRRLRIVPDGERVRGDLRLWKDDANTHVLPPQ